MTELDHAPAAADTKTTDDTPAAGEQRPGSTDNKRYPNGVTAADTDPGYYDGNTQAALAADTTPTRQQAARDAAAHDQARASGTGTTTTTETPAAPASSPGPDTNTILHENDNKPEPRTRQQAARDAAAHDVGRDKAGPAAPADSHSTPAGKRADTKAILHENDNLPEPRTRQQAARDAAAKTTPSTRHDTPGSNDKQAPAPEPLTRTASKDRPGPAGTEHQAADGAPPDSGASEAAGRDQQFEVVRIGPEEHTLGDTTPTGIGLKPTGEQLGEMEDPKASRADRARREFLSGEKLHDAFDATDDWANTGKDLFSRPPTEQHTEVPAQGPAFTPVPDQELEPGSLATAALAVGILGAEFFRWGRSKVEHTRGRHRASDR